MGCPRSDARDPEEYRFMQGPFDPDELVRWAETYGHPEGWAKKAQQLHADNERLHGEIARCHQREREDVMRIVGLQEERNRLREGTADA